MNKNNNMRDDVLKTLLGLGALTMMLFAAVGIGATIKELGKERSLYNAQPSVDITTRPEEVQRAIDLPLDEVSAEEFKQFQLLNGLTDE